ncbi:MAG: TetR family transcriptional regulator [Oscillospiraceae bacterium]|nr:TetR family transcriptional regulator [Oscillospiraceae bacterium]
MSLREVCKNAEFTTGALYKRFENNEALFDALVAPTLEIIKRFGDPRAITSGYLTLP